MGAGTLSQQGLASMMTWQDLLDIHSALPEPRPVVYRLYYNEQGQPIVYATDELPGNYIEVDAETFAVRPMDIKIVDGVIHQLPRRTYYRKLAPGTDGTLCHTHDVAVVVSESGTFWKLNSYEN